jgi:hypothetical protein
MASASEAHQEARRLTDREFEELLQRTWDAMQKQQVVVYEPAESLSWT